MNVCVVGLGTMGSNIALNLSHKNHNVHVFNRSHHKTFELCRLSKGSQNIHYHIDPNDMVRAMGSEPKAILCMLPHGGIIDKFIDSIKDDISPNDVIIDGANEHYQTSIKRGYRLSNSNIRYIGAGVSGGAYGALHGPCIMCGGSSDAFSDVQPILDSLSGDSPCTHFGPDHGSGHFVKMVHNGIEYAMLQAVSEIYDYFGKDLFLNCLESLSPHHPIYGYISEITTSILKNVNLDQIKDVAGMNSTGSWCVQYAAANQIAIPAISNSVDARILSNKKLFSNHSPSHKAYKEDILITETLSFAFACALYEGQLLCDHYGIDYQLALHTWTKGTIIRCGMLTDDYMAIITNNIKYARTFVSRSIHHEKPCPVLCSLVQWYDTHNASKLPMNLVMAQRFEFGHHPFQLES